MRSFCFAVLLAAAFPAAWSARRQQHQLDEPISLVQLSQQRGKARIDKARSEQTGPLSLLSGWTPWNHNRTLKVVFGVFTSPLPKYAEQMKAVTDTWAKDVAPQKLLVVGVKGDAPGITYKQAPMCQDGHINNPGISCKEATLLSTGYAMSADWVVVVGSDNYVFPKNMEERLEKEDKNKPQILAIFGCGGGKYCEDGKGGICGGGGYAISKAALEKMVGKGPDAAQKFIQESMQCASTVGGGWSDQVTSCIARRSGVSEVNLDGLYGWKLCDAGAMECPFEQNVYRDKILSTTPKTLTFHYIGPPEMYRIHKMVQDTKSHVSVLEQEQGDAQKQAVCRDNHQDCQHWAALGECNNNAPYMVYNCEQACDSCSKVQGLSFLQVSEDADYDKQRRGYVQMVNHQMERMA